MQDKKTEIVEKELEKTYEYDQFIEQNIKLVKTLHPGEYIEQLIKDREMKKSQVVSKLNINTGYAYEILRLEKVPDRDKMLQFAFV